MASKSRSLRVKLTLWFLIVFTAIQVALLGATAFLERDSIRVARARRVAESAREMVESLVLVDPELSRDDLGSLVPASASFDAALVRDESGATLASWNLRAGAEPPFGAWEIVPTGSLGPVTTTLAPGALRTLTGDSEGGRLLTVPYRVGGELRYLQILTRDQRLGLEIGPLLRRLWLNMPAGTIAALIAAWLIAGRAVAPMRRLSEAARDVSPERLSGRIEVETSDDEVSKLQHELNAALERLEAGYRAQEQFISNVSHELKTPIAVLLTEAQVVRTSTDSEERDAFVRRVEDEMRGLGRLVDTFLQIASAEIGARVSFEPVALHDLLLDVVEGAAALATRAGVALVPHIDEHSGAVTDARVQGDPVLLRTMLDNLVRNAVRHSPRGAPVRVELRRDARRARYAVRDLGPGIPEEAREQVFERFVRLEPGADEARDGRDRSGTGLGLSIAAQIAALHGGDIRASNADGGGAVFEVRLPLAGPRGDR